MGMSKEYDRFRTREQLTRDASLTLSSEMSVGSRYALLDNICWTWSEFDGKIDGCRWWSRDAVDVRADLKQLRHEHVVPRRVIIHRLLSLPVPDESGVFATLNDWCFGVVVTKAEDATLNAAGLQSRMPEDWDHQDVWARYTAVGIEVLEVIKK